jgi:hypothetical protein
VANAFRTASRRSAGSSTPQSPSTAPIGPPPFPWPFSRFTLSQISVGLVGTVLPYQIDRIDGVVSIVGPDPATPVELEEFLEALVRDPLFHVGDGFLRDRRGLPAPSADLVHGVMATMASVPELRRSRFAIVVPAGDQANFGMMRMAQILGSGLPLEIEIFTEESDARRWLRATPPMSHVVPPHIKHESEIDDPGGRTGT